jgi:hypothetical protein
MTRCTLVVGLWLLAASAWAQHAPLPRAAGSTQAHAPKRATAAKTRHKQAARAQTLPKTAAVPKAEPKTESTKGDTVPKVDEPGAAKAGHAETAPKVEAAPEPSEVQASSDVRTEGDTQVKMMEFSGLDIEGQLKTPQMLYFLNRLRAEFGRPRLPHRSFMPELERSTKESSF